MPNDVAAPPPPTPNDPESNRLAEDESRAKNWKRWGPYLSERQWGSVREDYSPDGNCWEYFPHDMSRSRAYRWGEDGLMGLTDRECRLCFALALWNDRDPILKERLFGLTNPEGNHGEDVKECYYYLDSTPTHSYMKGLYKYPQAEFPYDDLVNTNKARGKDQREYELEDTGAFNGDRYFDVQVEYAKAGPDDILIRITATNRGPDRAVLHLLPTLWFRNSWSWGITSEDGEGKPRLAKDGPTAVVAEHPTLGKFRLEAEPMGAVDRRRHAGRAAADLHRERDERRPAVQGRELLAVREGRLPRVRDRRPGRAGQPGRGGDQGRGVLRPGHAGRGRDPHPAAAVVGREAAGDAVRAGLHPDVQQADQRGRPVLRPPRPVHAAGGGPQRGPPGVRRAALGQAVLLLRRRATGSRATPPSPRHPPSRKLREPQRRAGSHLFCPRHSLHARQVGVPLVRRMGHWPSTWSPWPRWTLGYAKQPAPADPPAGVVHAPQRPDAGL